MIVQLLAFEFRYHTRRVLFALVTIVVCGMALVLAQTGYGAESAHVNSSYAVMRASGLLSLWILFSQTLFTVSGVLRDDEYDMRELIFSRPVSRGAYFLSRYLGVVLAGTVAMSLAVGVLAVTPLLMPSALASVGPARMLPYLHALGTLIVPNLLLVSALLCCVAWFSRGSLATYVGGIAIFALYMTAAMLGDSPLMASSAPPTAAGLARAALTDPFGLSAVFEQTRYWTLAERNVRLVSLTGHFLQNRLIILAVSALVLLIAYRRVSLGVGSRRRSDAPRKESAGAARPAITYAPVAPTISSRAHLLGAVVSSVRLEFRQLFGARVFQALLLLFVFITAVETSDRFRSGEYGTRILASSGEIVEAIPLRLFALLCLVYFGADLVWRERSVRMDGLIDATPSSNGAFVLSKLLALVLVPLALAAIGLAVAGVVQLTGNGLPISPSVYLSQFWYAAYPLALTAVMVVSVQMIAGNRWLGMLASMVVIVLAAAGPQIGLEHPMLQFASAPDISHSDFDGYGPAAQSFAAFMLYWTAGALSLGALGWGLWLRGHDAGLRRRLARLRGSRNPARRAILAAGVGFGVAGGLLFYHTNVLHAWESREASNTWHADYERTYRRLAGRPQPTVTEVDIAVDFTPAERRADIRGTLALQNRTAVPIDTVWLTIRREALEVQAVLAGAAQTMEDARFGVRAFALAEPLQPGASVTLQYAFTIASDGIRADGYNADVASNGSFLSMLVVMPTFGYRASYELPDPTERAKRGLPAATDGSSPHAAIDSLTRVARAEAQSDAWLTLHAVLSTSTGQTAVGPGTLLRTWAEGDRTFHEYQVNGRIPGRFGFASGTYAEERDSVDGVQVEFWHLPAHGQNAEQFVRAATHSLRLFNAVFGELPHSTLRLVEVPGRWPFAGFATSGLLLFNEQRGVLTDARGEDVDLLTRRVAHEVAHQWWGYAVSPLQAVGATTIVETLAKYSEQLVVEAEHGAEALPALIAFDHERYLAGRARDPLPEPSLVETASQDYLYYGKGAVAMHALRAALGDSAITRALRALIAQESGPRGAATAPQLHWLLRAQATSASDSALVDEWFTERVLYDLRADTAWAVREGDGYRLHATFRTERVRFSAIDEVGEPASGQAFDVVVHGEDNAVLYRGTVQATGSSASLSTVVTAAPTRVEIDPLIHRLDRDRSNNRVDVIRSAPF